MGAIAVLHSGLPWARACYRDLLDAATSARPIEGSSPRPLVVNSDNAAGIRGRLLQPEGRVDPFGERALAAAQDQRVEQKMKLVHQVVLEQCVNELVASIREDVLAGRCLELPHRLHDIAAN